MRGDIEFKNALQIKKKTSWAHGVVFRDRTAQSRTSKLLFPILSTIVELDPKDVDTRVKLGHFLMAGNALDRALEQANAAFELDRNNPGVLAFRAAVLLKLQDRVGAKREAQAALDIDPNNAEAMIVLAAEHMARDDSEGALAILDRPGVTLKRAMNMQSSSLNFRYSIKRGLETVRGGSPKTRGSLPQRAGIFQRPDHPVPEGKAF